MEFAGEGKMEEEDEERAAAAAKAARVEPPLSADAVANIQANRLAFERHCQLRDASLEGTGLSQWQLLPLLGDEILEDLLEEMEGELEEAWNGIAESLLKAT
jgi:hypothetical protein